MEEAPDFAEQEQKDLLKPLYDNTDNEEIQQKFKDISQLVCMYIFL
jgi:hypothetical protein